MTDSAIQPTQRMRPGVKALIVHEGKILVIHERLHHTTQTSEIMDFPGGGIDFGENLIDALKREIFEEVGLTVEVQNVVGAWDFVIPHKSTTGEKAGVHIVCIGYQCSLVGEPTIDLTHNPAPEDIFDARWYTQDELLKDAGFASEAAGMLQAVANLRM